MPKKTPESISESRQFVSTAEMDLKKILIHLLEEEDAGGYYVVSGAATTDIKDNIIDTKITTMPLVKGYCLYNEGANKILIGHNITGVSAEYIFQEDLHRLIPVKAGGRLKMKYNKKRIGSVFIKTDSGTSDFTLLLVW